jgi:hypothetical protein
MHHPTRAVQGKHVLALDDKAIVDVCRESANALRSDGARDVWRTRWRRTWAPS